MSLEERISRLVKLESIGKVQPRAFKKLMKKIAVETKKSVTEVENLFTGEMNRVEQNIKMARVELSVY